MTTFTADAQQIFDRYIQTVRWSVRGVADPDEIERDVREHVSSALEAEAGPVSSQTLHDVLARLGDPWQWVAPEDLPFWRRVVMRFSLGPDDWRLAYACFGLTLLGMLLIPVGIGFVFLIAAYFLGRATYSLVMDRDGTLGPRKWLVYPPLVFFGICVALVFLMGPVPPIAAWGVGEHGFRAIYKPSIAYDVAAVLMMTGSWWIFLSGVFALFPRAVRAALVPMATNFRRVSALWLTGFGAITLAFGIGIANVW